MLEQLYCFIDRRVDGIILWAHLALLCTKLIIEDLEMRNLPVVTIDHELPFADTIETDEQMGTRLSICSDLDIVTWYN
ncbi:MAG: hypothetical protein ACYTFW_07785 [Planctomycetota bacterium]